MSQERPSKSKRKTGTAYIKAGTMASLANQIRNSFSQKYTIPARQSNKERPNIIEENLLLSQCPGVVTHVQTRSTTLVVEVVEEQVQLNSTTPISDEQCEEQVQAAWKKHKSRLNKYNFDAYGNDDTRRLHMLEDVPASRFKKLLKYWNSEKLQRISKTNIENRKKLKNPHSTGKRSFALIQSKLEKGKESSDPLSSKELYVATGKRKLGRSYKCSYEDTTSAAIADESSDEDLT